MEKRFIIEALRRSNGSKKEAADMLGINTRTLLRKRNQYNINQKLTNQMKCLVNLHNEK